MSAVPLFKEVWHQARRERRAIEAEVMMADDSIRRVKFGPRGGWKFIGD
jgi:hypothetical protein